MRYYLAHNEIDIFHYGKLEDNQQIETGMPFLEFYTELDNLLFRLSNLGVEYKEEERITNPIDEVV
jgi:hypothetical protein